MAINFHCDHCGKEIRAADSAGGKWGKCPSCHNKLYVPNLNIADELTLAPVDESEEEKKKRLMAETYKLTHDILQERELPADGELNAADATAKSVARGGRQAIAILDTIALSDIPEPELAHIAPQVLAGLIRTLRSRMN